MHPQRIAVAIAAGVGMVCSFMPWTNERWLRAVGGAELANLRWATLLCCAAILGGMVAVRRAESLTPGGMGLCRLLGGITTLLAVMGIVGINSKIDETPFGRTVSINPGLYLLLMAGLAIAVLPNIIPTRSGAQS